MKKQSITLVFLMAIATHFLCAQSAEERRILSDFDAIIVEGAGNLYLSSGSKNEVLIKLKDSNYELSDITTEVMNGKLYIDHNKRKKWKTSPKVDIWITYRAINRLEVRGAGKITTENPIQAEKLVLDCSGAETASMELNVGHLSAKLSGAGSFQLSGRADVQFLEISGAGKIMAEDLVGKEINAEVSGVGSMTVHATESLKGRVSGVGNIRYAGNPKIRDISSDGLGSVKPIN